MKIRVQRIVLEKSGVERVALVRVQASSLILSTASCEVKVPCSEEYGSLDKAAAIAKAVFAKELVESSEDVKRKIMKEAEGFISEDERFSEVVNNIHSTMEAERRLRAESKNQEKGTRS